MTSDERHKSLEKIINFYGPMFQCEIAIEEMSELTKAICKVKRADNAEDFNAARESMIEEIADVQIMILQMIEVFDCDNEVAEMIDEKIERQISRIKAKEVKSEDLYIRPDDGGSSLPDDL